MIYDDIFFIHIPRTGGTSIEHAFEVAVPNAEKHLSAQELRNKVGESEWNGRFVFSFVRNPWDRVISLFHQPFFRNINRLSGNSLKYFLQMYRPAPWEKMHFCDYLDSDGVDFIGRYENRSDDLEQIGRRVGIRIDPNIHERRTSRKSDYRSYYDDETAQMVSDTNRIDIDRFGYEF